MAFDVRAMENIATAPATPAERLVAGWAAGAFLVMFVLTIPFAWFPLPPIAAAVPTITGAAAIAQVLTAVLFYVQYRIARAPQLALMALAFGTSAVLTAFFALAFPGVFAPGGLFGATLQTAPWIAVIERTLFSAFLIAFACADRFGWRASRVAVRWLTLAVAAFVVVSLIAAFRAPLPLLIEGTGISGLTAHVVVPLDAIECLVALALLAGSGLRTVTQVWLAVVAVIRVVEVLVNSPLLGGTRYTVGWYASRIDVLLASTVVLAVFLVKINDLLLRLASRNRALAERTESAELQVAAGELRYRLLANAVPQLIWTADADGTVDYVNDRWSDYTGLDVTETRARGWRAALDETQPTTLDDGWHESLRTGRPFRAEYRLRDGRSGRLRWFLINAIPMRGAGGAVARWIASCTDIDQSKRIEQREVFLAKAGDRLSASLDLNATLGTIADLVAGRMASWARVDLLDTEGHFVTSTVASTDREEEVALRDLLGCRPEPAIENAFHAVLAKRAPGLEYGRTTFSAGLPGVRPGAAIVVPLISGDTLLGTLTLVRSDRDGAPAEDVAIASDFGRRASQAIDHARLYERERSTADVLQRAMLPQAMPQLENVSFSASYSAASETQRVGGDFYDAFLLPDGRVALTIGDVTGHGLEAAVIMGEIRQALRAASFERAEPAAILDRASRLLVASGRSLFVTAVFGVLDTQTGMFRYATAGHPPPILFDGTSLTRLASSGLPIGLRDEEGVDFALTLPPACTIVLYTDGLLEFIHDLEEGERRIEEAIRDLGHREVEHLAGEIMKRVLGSDPATDDIAILTATVHDLPLRPKHEQREWHLASSDARSAAMIRREIGALIAAWTGRENASYESELAFGELFSNVVRHAPGPVVVRAVQTDLGAEIFVNDRGPGFVDRAQPIDELAESGRGMHLVRALAADVAIVPNGSGGTSVRVAFAGNGKGRD